MARSYGTPPPDATSIPQVKFILEVDGIRLMAFEKITPNDGEWGVIENRTGLDELHKIPSSGLKKTRTFDCEKTLRDEGGTEDIKEIINWHESGSLDRRTGAVIYEDREGNEILRLEFSNAWVSKATPPEMDASQENSPYVFKFTIICPKIKAA